MTTILTVHGTFAGGKEAGTDWWQRGSPFQQRIAELVDSGDGKLEFQPFMWDGLNSETSRRTAGLVLFERMLALEAAGEPYSIIGHSHGGSVISAALLEAAKRDNELEQMRSWLTIGTPFIQTRKERFLFGRLGLFGKSVYVALLTVSLLIMAAFYPHIGDNFNRYGYLVVGEIALFFLPFILFYAIASYLDGQRLHLYNATVRNFAELCFSARWLSLWHANDEAVQGLRAVKSAHMDIFPKGFAIGPLSLTSIVILPLFVLFLIFASDSITDIYDHAKRSDWIVQDIEKRVVFSAHRDATASVKAKKIMVLVASTAARLTGTTRLHAGEHDLNTGTIISLLAVIAYYAIIALALAMLITAIVNALARWTSHGLSRRLNPITMNQIRAMALGSDTIADRAVDAEEWPMWLGHGYPPLPEPLSAQLQAVSDAAVSKAVPKFRNAARQFTSTESRQEKIDMLSEYLTWEELIHTSYFQNPQFCKLIAFALTKADGLRAAEAFAQDPDFDDVAAWYQQITRAAGSPMAA